MFSIITNYKKLTLSFLRNDFAETPSTVDGDYLEPNGTNIDDLVQNILSDERIDAKDKEYLINLEKELKSDKNDIYKDTKEKTKTVMSEVLKDVLENGYYIENEDSLVSLQKMINIAGADLPDLSKEVGNRIVKEKDSDNIIIFNEGTFTAPGSDFVYIKQDNGEYKKIRSGGSSFNIEGNDNTFDGYQRAAAVHLDANDDQIEGEKVKAQNKEIKEKENKLKGLIDELNKETGVQWDFDSIINKINNELSDKIKLPVLEGQSYSIDQKVSIVTEFLNFTKNNKPSSNEAVSASVVEKEVDPKDLPKKLKKFKTLSDRVDYRVDLGNGKSVTGKITKLTSYTSGTDTSYKITINGTEISLTESTIINSVSNSNEQVETKINSDKKAIEWNKKRYTNSQVEKIQTALGIDSDGKFGPNTLAAVKKFQAEHNLTVDGKIGKQTLKVLNVSFTENNETTRKTKENKMNIPSDNRVYSSEEIKSAIDGIKEERIKKVGEYINMNGEKEEIILKKVETPDNEYTGEKGETTYLVELDNSGKFIDPDVSFNHIPTEKEIKDAISKLIKDYQDNDLSENNEYVLNSEFELSAKEIKQLGEIGIDLEEVIDNENKTKIYRLDRSGLWSNDFNISKVDGKLVLKDDNNKVELKNLTNDTIKDALTKSDEYLKLLNEAESKLSYNESKNSYLEKEDLSELSKYLKENTTKTITKLSEIEKIIDKLGGKEGLLLTEDEKAKKVADEVMEAAGMDKAFLESINADYKMSGESIRLDRDGTNDLLLEKNENGKLAIKDDHNLVNITPIGGVSEIKGIVKSVSNYLDAVDSVANPGSEGFEEGSKEALLKEYLDGLDTITTVDELNKVLTIISSKENLKSEIQKEKAEMSERKEKLSKGDFTISSFEERDGEIIVKIDGIEGLNEYKVDGEFEGEKITHHNVETGEEFVSVANVDDNQVYTVKLNTAMNDGVSDSDTIVELDKNEFGVGYIDKDNYLKAQKESIKKYIQKQNEK